MPKILETRRGDIYQSAFHKKYPNAIKYIVGDITTVSDIRQLVRWGKESLLYDAMVDIQQRHLPNSNKKRIVMIWYLTDEVDVMAVKLTHT